MLSTNEHEALLDTLISTIENKLSGAPDNAWPQLLNTTYTVKLSFNPETYDQHHALKSVMESQLTRGVGISWTWTFGYQASTVLWIEGYSLEQLTDFLKFANEYNARTKPQPNTGD